LVWVIPGIVTGKTDVFPSKRGHVAEQVVRHGPTCGPQGLDGGLEIAGVPQDDCRNQKVKDNQAA
jgi:hypothetical protein